MVREAMVSAPGNIFLAGEHSVVYFQPAIVAAIGKRTTTKIEYRDDDLVTIDSFEYGSTERTLNALKNRQWTVRLPTADDLGVNDYKTDEDSVLAPLKDLVGRFAEKCNLDRGFDISIYSDIPRDSGGMSSSSAVLCSVYGALRVLHDMNLSPEGFFDYLFEFQRKIHGGAASGAEIVSSSLGGYNRVRKTEVDGKVSLGERVNLGKRDLYLVIGDTGKRAETPAAVAKVRTAWTKDPVSYEMWFGAIGGLVKAEEQLIKSGDVRLLGQAMDKNHEILREQFHVSSPELERLIDVSRSHGALGAKLSGGGMGGVMVALAETPDVQQRIAEAIKGVGGKPYITTVGGEGVKVE